MDKGPIFDNREPQKMFDILDLHYEYPYQKEQLLIGDVVLSQDAVIEIKRVELSGNHDLKASLHDDRIHKQAKARQENYKWNALIILIENDTGLLFDPYFTPKHWESLQMTMKVQFNSHLFLVQSEERLISLIYAIWDKVKEGPYYVDPCNKTPRPNPIELYDNQMYLLSGLYDLGKEKCKVLLDHFKYPILIIKWILFTKINTSLKHPKISETSVRIPGFGPKFFLKNQKLLKEKQSK